MTTHRIATLWERFCYRSEFVQVRIAQAKKSKKVNPFKRVTANCPGWKSFKKKARTAEILSVVKCQMRAS